MIEAHSYKPIKKHIDRRVFHDEAKPRSPSGLWESRAGVEIDAVLGAFHQGHGPGSCLRNADMFATSTGPEARQKCGCPNSAKSSRPMVLAG